MPNIEFQKLNWRLVLRWLIIPVCLSTFAAHQVILSKYILPLPPEVPTPMLLRFLLWWRNLSLLLALLSSLASLPKWGRLPTLS
jgi:hypothetical protein